MSRDDPDRHLWVVPEPEVFTRMSRESLEIELKALKDRNDRAWAETVQRLQQRSSRRARQ